MTWMRPKEIESTMKDVDARYWNGRAYQEGHEHAHAKVEFDWFLQHFPKHDLAPEVRTRVARCEAEIKKCESAQDKKE